LAIVAEPEEATFIFSALAATCPGLILGFSSKMFL